MAATVVSVLLSSVFHTFLSCGTLEKFEFPGNRKEVNNAIAEICNGMGEKIAAYQENGLIPNSSGGSAIVVGRIYNFKI